MILGVSHLTLAATNIDEDLAVLARLGYAPRFVEYNLPSHPSKFRFLSQPWAVHDLSYTTAPSGLPIELVKYNDMPPRSVGNMLPVFSLPPIDGLITHECRPIHGRAIMAALCATSIATGELPRLSSQAFFVETSTNGDKAILSAVMIPVKDVFYSRNFWETGLGFRCLSQGAGWVRLDFPSPLPAWRFIVVLVQDDDYWPDTKLDSVGATCLSLICTNLEKDSNAIVKSGQVIEATGAFTSVIGNQSMHLEMLLGPDRIFIELMQLDNGKSGK